MHFIKSVASAKRFFGQCIIVITNMSNVNNVVVGHVLL